MKILVIDDHPLVREAMTQLVMRLGGAIEVYDAQDCKAGLALARSHPDFDLVLLDLNLPGLCGIPAPERFRIEHPTMPVVVVSVFRDRATVSEVMRHGAVGFIPKSSGSETIVNPLRLVLAGSVYVPPEVALAQEQPDPSLPVGLRMNAGSSVAIGLTPRQGRVLALVMQGRANKEIYRELGLAERTVKAHRTAVLNALKVTSRTQAVLAASRLGLDPEGLLAVARIDES